MLDTVRPKLWKRISIILLILGIGYGLFEGTCVKIFIAYLITGILEIITVTIVWIDCFVSRRLLRKYQNALIDLTEIN
jgi:hypothetical protein